MQKSIELIFEYSKLFQTLIHLNIIPLSLPTIANPSKGCLKTNQFAFRSLIIKYF
jgi:hypothetical protein